MLVTRNWLNEWIDISKISTDDICKTLNAIGLEVDSVANYRIPQKIVVGKVLECEKHPDADKLSVCQVDTGEGISQIVCGAKNVAAGQIVPVALIGAVLGENFKIKKAKLRDVESSGMICSAEELGLPKLNDGILVLDDSIGDLETGQELSKYPLLNDDVIDIELTANRGDCLSIYGVARDLTAALNLDLNIFNKTIDNDRRGIGRVLKFDTKANIDSLCEYRFFNTVEIKTPLLYDIRLALIEESQNHDLLKYISYTTHSTGVLLRVYDFYKFSANEEAESIIVTLKQDEDGLDVVANENNQTLGVIGLYQNPDSMPNENSNSLIVEASYIDPEIISSKRAGLKLEYEEHYYRSSRGSEPNLSLGINYFAYLLQKECDISMYSGSQKVGKEQESAKLQISHKFIENFIGQSIDSNRVLQILKKLGFDITINEQDKGCLFIVEIPNFRPDIKNEQDIVEEIVRIVGIDNIASKAMQFTEKRRLNKTYFDFKKRLFFRENAAANGFFETVHYFFGNKELMQKYGLETVSEKQDLTNPITSELNTFRSTLVLHLINSASQNIKFGRKSIRLFEVGRVVDKNRKESNKMAFIFSGEEENPAIKNNGKPKSIDFFSFSEKVSNVIGNFELQKVEDKNQLVSPYEYARVLISGKDAGYIGRVHINIEKEFDLPKSYICELDFDALVYEKKIVKEYSKFPATSRDLSLLVPKDMPFSKIRTHLSETVADEILNFYPIDLYESEELGNNQSLTIKFVLQSSDKTLQEDDINQIMDKILNSLNDTLQIGIR